MSKRNHEGGGDSGDEKPPSAEAEQPKHELSEARRDDSGRKTESDKSNNTHEKSPSSEKSASSRWFRESKAAVLYGAVTFNRLDQDNSGHPTTDSVRQGADKSFFAPLRGALQGDLEQTPQTFIRVGSSDSGAPRHVEPETHAEKRPYDNPFRREPMHEPHDVLQNQQDEPDSITKNTDHGDIAQRQQHVVTERDRLPSEIDLAQRESSKDTGRQAKHFDFSNSPEAASGEFPTSELVSALNNGELLNELRGAEDRLKVVERGQSTRESVVVRQQIRDLRSEVLGRLGSNPGFPREEVSNELEAVEKDLNDLGVGADPWDTKYADLIKASILQVGWVDLLEVELGKVRQRLESQVDYPRRRADEIWTNDLEKGIQVSAASEREMVHFIAGRLAMEEDMKVPAIAKLISDLLDFSPAGTVKALNQYLSGQNMITGQELTLFERVAGITGNLPHIASHIEMLVEGGEGPSLGRLNPKTDGEAQPSSHPAASAPVDGDPLGNFEGQGTRAAQQSSTQPSARSPDTLSERAGGEAAHDLASGAAEARNVAYQFTSRSEGPHIDDGGIRLDNRTSGHGKIDFIKGDRLPDGAHSITIEGRLGPKVSRADLEETLPVRSGSDRAHLWGRKFGDEAAAGIMYADPGFNNSWQQRVENTIENFGKNVADNGDIANLQATVVSKPNAPNDLDHVVYKVWETTPQGKFVEGWAITVDHQGVASDVSWLTSPPKSASRR